MRLVLASNNAGKLAELQALFAPLGVALVRQGELGIAEADEPHPTFIENALAKARHAALHARGAAIADDSGLCVDALGGAPGVRSARYAQDCGQGKGDAANNRVLLEKLGSLSPWERAGGETGLSSGMPRARPAVPACQPERALQVRAAQGDSGSTQPLTPTLSPKGRGSDRTARFVCALVAVRSADDPQPLIAMGRWAGVILPAPRGDAGFGYDPLLLIPELNRSVAELSADEKNARSHRGQAAREMLRQMHEVWGLG